MHPQTIITVAMFSGLMLCACGAPRPAIQPPDDVNARQTEIILSKIKELGQDGDWLVARGYDRADRFVSKAARTQITHAALLDRTREEVLESETKGIYATKLRDYIQKSHRIVLIRPMWSTTHPKAPRKALRFARGRLGGGYDYLGLAGINDEKKFYCSELVFYAYAEYFGKKQDVPPVIEPDQLYLWGTVLYDSRPRNEW